MLSAIEHFSRIRVEQTTLQVISDQRRDLDRLIHEEEAVIGSYVRLGSWPHKSVNLFVLADLQPLVAQIKAAAVSSSVIADDIDRRPMVIIYDAGSLAECTIFVNRGVLQGDGTWNDRRCLRALLAHEHAHPLAENEAVRAARALSVEVEGSGAAWAAVQPIVLLLADRLLLHAVQEVFANEIAIAAGFAEVLFHLDQDVVERACVGLRLRPSLVQSLDRQVSDGTLGADDVAALLLVGDLQAYLPFALETGPFLRTGHQREAEVLDARLTEAVWPNVDPLARDLYTTLREHYGRLRPDLGPAAVAEWAEEALAEFAEVLRRRQLDIRVSLVRVRSGRNRGTRPPRTGHAGTNQDHGGGRP